jgi:Tfp pilus assembly major pilin PilA
MIAAWMAANPGRALMILLVVALLAGLGIRSYQLALVRADLAVARAERDQVRAAALECSAGTQRLEEAAAEARKRAAQAVAQARAASATREPAIVALVAAEKAGGALSCGDAVERVRDALGR